MYLVRRPPHIPESSQQSVDASRRASAILIPTGAEGEKWDIGCLMRLESESFIPWPKETGVVVVVVLVQVRVNLVVHEYFCTPKNDDLGS